MKIQDQGSPDVVGAGGGIAGRQMDDEGPLDLPEIGVGHRDGDGAGVSGVGLIRHVAAAGGGCRHYDRVEHRGRQKLPRSHAAKPRSLSGYGTANATTLYSTTNNLITLSTIRCVF